MRDDFLPLQKKQIFNTKPSKVISSVSHNAYEYSASVHMFWTKTAGILESINSIQMSFTSASSDCRAEFYQSRWAIYSILAP